MSQHPSRPTGTPFQRCWPLQATGHSSHRGDRLRSRCREGAGLVQRCHAVAAALQPPGQRSARLDRSSEPRRKRKGSELSCNWCISHWRSWPSRLSSASSSTFTLRLSNHLKAALLVPCPRMMTMRKAQPSGARIPRLSRGPRHQRVERAVGQQPAQRRSDGGLRGHIIAEPGVAALAGVNEGLQHGFRP